ncbi:unnamed protein product [Callosobruchus maculatus]|uniref:C2H2-type domain-containing protein n=1 Tax=Callosobruchus maculatus TaxID=64391 RepID=A0A653BYU4_CALMS|nr:unnamed protein product [Callosobruchus maculatus]
MEDMYSGESSKSKFTRRKTAQSPSSSTDSAPELDNLPDSVFTLKQELTTHYDAESPSASGSAPKLENSPESIVIVKEELTTPYDAQSSSSTASLLKLENLPESIVTVKEELTTNYDAQSSSACGSPPKLENFPESIVTVKSVEQELTTHYDVPSSSCSSTDSAPELENLPEITMGQELSVREKIRMKIQATQTNADRNSFSCYYCNYTFLSKHRLIDHMKVHKTKKNMLDCDPCRGRSRGSRTCLRCNAKFRRQITLDEHILKTHPNFVATVTSKVFECKLCAFKTTIGRSFKEHLFKHPEVNTNYKLKTCTHCDATFRCKTSLDYHLIRKHPDFISSVTNKLHKCTKCSFVTVKSSHLKGHMSTHSETPVNDTLWNCLHCEAMFKRKASLDNHTIKNHPNFISTITNRVHKCSKCSYETTMRGHLKNHLLTHVETPTLCTCLHCTETFKNKLFLDDHIVKKHPIFIASVTSKIHECTLCPFKTTRISTFKEHVLEHPEINTNRKSTTCTQCNVTFNRKIALDNHIVKKHPNLTSSVTNKIHKCTKCSYKTTINSSFKRHLLKHPQTNTPSVINKIHKRIETSDKQVLRTCAICYLAFKNKISLDDHIVKKHPNFIPCVTSKIHECTQCTYKTTVSGRFTEHLLKHSKTNPYFIHKISTCKHCNATFKSKSSLDNHIIKKHPSFISSVTNKIHKCTKCKFATVKISHLKAHLSTHSKTPANDNIWKCLHCEATFKRKASLDNHTIKNHPNFISTITNRVHKCTKCTFKTTIRGHLKYHLSKHSETSCYPSPKT